MSLATEALPRVRTPVVDDPKDTPGIVVGWACHDLLNQTIKGGAASGGFAAAEDTGTMNVESCDVGPGSAAAILIFDAHRALRRRGQSGMLAASGLDAGLLVGRDDKFIVFEGFTVPGALIQIQDPAGLDGEGRVAGEDPAAVVPGADGVLMEPPPNRAARDSGNQTGIADLTGDVRSVPVGERDAMSSWRLASRRLNLNDQFWGEKPGDDPGGSARPVRRVVLRRSAFSTC